MTERIRRTEPELYEPVVLPPPTSDKPIRVRPARVPPEPVVVVPPPSDAPPRQRPVRLPPEIVVEPPPSDAPPRQRPVRESVELPPILVEPIPVREPPARPERIIERGPQEFPAYVERVRPERPAIEPRPQTFPTAQARRERVNPANAFWIVGGDESQVWSSAAGAYVAPDSPDAQAFLAENKRFLRTPDAGTLTEYLTKFGLTPATITEAMVVAERERRLAAGFNYDFGDARGVHLIGTTEQDMKGWDEVTKLASARINRGRSTAITIVTNTGPVQVTPTEWQDILLYAAEQFRQPIWFASFTLMAMSPIPANYTDNQYWP